MKVRTFDAADGIERLHQDIEGAADADFIHIKHDREEMPDRNMISISRKKPHYRATLSLLVNRGFHLYNLKDDTSSFAAFNRVPGILTEVESGKVIYDDNAVAHTFTPAEVNAHEKLLVVFSSIALKPHQSSVRRHFEHNFASIGKYITPNTHILRIADLGGVGGGWYTDTNFLRNNSANVRALIVRTCSSLGIDPSEAVLYGVSKGGTAALYHALPLGAKAVPVDPIVSDRLYVETYDDLHFTLGNFPKTKDEIFAEMRAAGPSIQEGGITIVTSDRSPQFAYINRILFPWMGDRASFVNVSHPHIADHPDVGPKSISTTVMLINMKLHGLSTPPGNLSAPFSRYG